MPYDPLFADAWYDRAPIDELRREVQRIYEILTTLSGASTSSASTNLWDFGSLDEPSPFSVDFGSLLSPGSTSIDFGSI